MATPYITGEDFRSYLRADHPNVSKDDIHFELELRASAGAINQYCGRTFHRVIGPDDDPVARTFPVLADDVVEVHDFWTVDDLVVATDDDDDGVYETTWEIGVDFEVEPADGIVRGLDGFPFWELHAIGSRSWPTGGRRRRPLQVTARWGWEAVLDEIIRANRVLAVGMLSLRDAPLGVMATAEFGGVRVPLDQFRLVHQVLGPFRRAEHQAVFA